MRYMEDNPREGYAFLYISVEDIDDTEKFFEILSEELLGSTAVSRLIKASEKAQSIFSQFAEHIKKGKSVECGAGNAAKSSGQIQQGL